MTKEVITRFAPSPTGFLHIGGARTALFNWLYAKANNGKMLLRIEDTDRARYNLDAVDAIKDGLSWLGIEWDGDAISQFERADRHAHIANEMVDRGTAYRCYCTAAEIEAMREKARAEGRSPRYDGTWRDRTPEPGQINKPHVIRLKAPTEGETIVDDQVQGEIRFPNKDLDDLVLLRSDGTPTYMLAVVVDDHDMGVTHIIRGDDHLINAARQSLIYHAMDWEVPIMAHIPLIHGADGAKLSKRHGAIGAEAYRSMGYLPEAMRNYLVRLGWSHGDDEIFSTDQMIDWFGFDGMNKAAARFDFTKLESINSHYLKEMADTELLQLILETVKFLDTKNGLPETLSQEDKALLLRALPALKERSKTLVDLVQGTDFLFAERPVPLDEKAAKTLNEDAVSVITDILSVLSSLEDWDEEKIGETIRGFAADKGLKLGQVAQPIRAALSGKGSSPGAFDLLQIFGKEESLERLQDRAKANLR